ncbi:MAG: transcriptional repressor [Candidatus Nitrospinota bacterium M3_3B_026]
MSIINTKEVRKKISYYESKIDALKQLLEISRTLESEGPVRAGKKTARKKKGRPAGRKRRGAVSNAIVTMLENSSRPLTAGEIKSGLEEQKLAKKGSSSVYSTLLQMSKRGVVKKVKTAKGNCYKLASSKARQEKARGNK